MSTPKSTSTACVSTVVFDAQLMPRKTTGEPLNASILGLVMTTLRRTAEQVGTTLELGDVRRIRAMGLGHASELTFQDGGAEYRLHHGVSSWADLEPALSEPTDVLAEYPLLPTPLEIRHLLHGETRTRSCSFQRLSSGDWEHFAFDADLAELKLESVAMLMLQMDVLCREQDYPRGRFHLEWADGAIWFWVSEMENLMMAVTHADPTAEEIQLLIRCGDAFQVI